MIENITMTFFKGSQGCEESRAGLELAVQEFNSTFSHFGHQIGFKTLARVEGAPWPALCISLYDH